MAHALNRSAKSVKVAIIVMLGLAAFIFLLLVGTFEVKSVDLKTFREKTETRLFGFTVFEKTYEGNFARFVREKELNKTDQAVSWQIYYSSSFFAPISPHYKYHSLPGLLNQSMDWSRELSPDCRVKFAEQLIELVRSGKTWDISKFVDEFLYERQEIQGNMQQSFLGSPIGSRDGCTPQCPHLGDQGEGWLSDRYLGGGRKGTDPNGINKL